MQSQNKAEMFSIIHEYHNLLKKAGLKAAPETNLLLPQKNEIFGTRHFI